MKILLKNKDDNVMLIENIYAIAARIAARRNQEKVETRDIHHASWLN